MKAWSSSRSTETTAEPRPFGPIARFLVFSAGARPEILAVCPTDRAAYLGLGGTVVATSLLALISMVFALRTALDTSLTFAVAGGVVWAGIVYNLDRWLVASQKRLGSAGKQLLATVPRLAMAMLFGIVISEPLVIRLFRPEIDRQIVVDRNEALARAAEERTDGPKAKEIARNKVEIDELAAASDQAPEIVAAQTDQIKELKAEINEASDALNQAEVELTKEIEGIAVSGQSGCGEICAVKQLARDQAKTRYDSVFADNQPQIDALQVQVDQALADNASTVQAERERRQERILALEAQNQVLQEQIDEEYSDVAEQRDAGLLADIKALDHLGHENSAVLIAHWVLVALFMALDTLPVFGKLLQSLGPRRPYEVVADAMERKVAEEAQAIEDEAEADRLFKMELRTSDRGARSDAEQANIRHFVERAANTQREVGDLILDAWRARELDRTQRDVDRQVGNERRRGERRQVDLGPPRGQRERRHSPDRRGARRSRARTR